MNFYRRISIVAFLCLTGCGTLILRQDVGWSQAIPRCQASCRLS